MRIFMAAAAAAVILFLWAGVSVTLSIILVTVFAILACKSWSLHLDLVAAETAIGATAREWRGSQSSRLHKRNERLADCDWEASRTIAALISPAARYRDISTHSRALSSLAGPETLTPSEDGRYPQLILDESGHWRRLPAQAAINCLTVHEEAPVVDFKAPGKWQRELNEEDRKKGSRRKAQLRLNSTIYSILVSAGPRQANREIIARLRRARRMRTEDPAINAHLQAAAEMPGWLVRITIAIFRHPGRHLWFEDNGNLYEGKVALRFFESLE